MEDEHELSVLVFLVTFASVIASVSASLFTGSITIQSVGTKTIHGVTVPDEDSWTTASTVTGTIQPASSRALQRAGLVARDGLVMAFLPPVAIRPMTSRVQANSVTYRVLNVRTWSTHIEVLMEEVTA